MGVGAVAYFMPNGNPTTSLSEISFQHHAFFFLFAAGVRTADLNLNFMESGLPLFGTDVPRSVRVRQIIATVLLAIPVIMQMLNLYSYLWESVIVAVINICNAIGFLILMSLASAQPIKTALKLGCLWSVVIVAISLFEQVDLIVIISIGIIKGFIWTYFFSLFYCNNSLSEKLWCNLLIVNQMLLPVLHLISGIDPNVCFLANPIGCSLSMYFQIVWGVLLIFAYFKFSSSEIFSGKDNWVLISKGVYTPLNKYVVGAFVTSGVTIAAIWIYSEYVASLLLGF